MLWFSHICSCFTPRKRLQFAVEGRSPHLRASVAGIDAGRGVSAVAGAISPYRATASIAMLNGCHVAGVACRVIARKGFADMPDVLKTPDILRRYRITPPTLRRWLRAGRFPQPFVIANRSLWRSADIEAFELSRRLP